MNEKTRELLPLFTLVIRHLNQILVNLDEPDGKRLVKAGVKGISDSLKDYVKDNS